MKVRIKTAHGYLSFQPDGRIEYRPSAGPWENIDVEGLVFEPVQPAPGPTPSPTPGPLPMMNAAYVANVKSQCLAAGMDLSGPCGAFAITKRVAWGLRALGAGLLSKPNGNNCEGYSTDVIVFRDGSAVDILSDGGNNNGPIWQSTDVDDLANRWRPAVEP